MQWALQGRSRRKKEEIPTHPFFSAEQSECVSQGLSTLLTTNRQLLPNQEHLSAVSRLQDGPIPRQLETRYIIYPAIITGFAAMCPPLSKCLSL